MERRLDALVHVRRSENDECEATWTKEVAETPDLALRFEVPPTLSQSQSEPLASSLDLCYLGVRVQAPSRRLPIPARSGSCNHDGSATERIDPVRRTCRGDGA
jgi:hypothetical protein